MTSPATVTEASIIEPMDEVYEGTDDIPCDESLNSEISPIGGMANVNNDSIQGDKFGKTMEELNMPEHERAAIRHSWNAFQKALGDSEAVGDAIYGVLTGSLHTVKEKFKTPRAVLCLALFNGFRVLALRLDDPAGLLTFVEILGFKHLTFEVTMQQTSAVVEGFAELLMQQVPGQELVPGAVQAWRNLLFYVGSCLRYVSITYSRRLQLIGEDWKAIQDSANANEDEANVRSFPKMCAFSNEVMGETLDAWMEELLTVFEVLVSQANNPSMLLEECDLLSITIVNLSNGGDIDFDRFKPIMLAALRSLLPKTWSMEHETAWQWLWKTIATNLMEATMRVRSYKPWSTKLYGAISDEHRESFRADIYIDFFQKCAMSQELFKQSTTRLRYIADRILASAYDMLHKPVQEMVDELSALGLRHVGYGVPVELFAPFTDTIVITMKPIVAEIAKHVTIVAEAGRSDTHWLEDFNVPDKMMLDGFRWSLGLTARILMRTITEGSTSVMQAISKDDHRQITKALNDAPRFDRVRWQLRVKVGTQTISPLHYALRSGSHQKIAGAVRNGVLVRLVAKSARKMIADVLTIRADRQRYYYGVDDLFNYQPDVAEHVCEEAPFLAMDLLEGLVWRSNKSHEGTRSVIYYLEHLLQDITEDSTLSRSLKTFIEFKDAKIIQHPILVFTMDLLWSRLVLRVFLSDRCWTGFTFIIYIFSQCSLNQPHNLETAVGRNILAGARLLVYICGLGRLIYWHCRETCRARNRNDMIKLGRCSIPAYWAEYEHRVSLALLLVLMGMLFVEPMFYCLGADDIFEFKCDEYLDEMHIFYQIFSALGVFLFCSMILDLAALNIRMAAYKVLCAQALDQMMMCGLALLVTIVTFSFVISSLSRETLAIQSQDWKTMDGTMKALTQIAFGLFSMESISQLAQDSGLIFACVVLYSIAVYTCLFNLLVSQFCGIYMALAEDIEGHARLVRGHIILTVLKDIPLKKWQAFVSTLKLDERVDFAEGDIGLPGGVKIHEPAYMHPVAHDQILRYGGKTDPSLPWPEKDDGDESMEALIQRTVHKSIKSALGQSSSTGETQNHTGSIASSQHGQSESTGLL